MSLTDEKRLSDLAAYSGDPWNKWNKYFDDAEPHMKTMWGWIYDFIKDCDFDSVVDLAAGHGRNTEMLAGLARKVVVLDIQEHNIAFCRNRFRENDKVSCFVNNGYDMRDVPTGSVSLVYSFDSMVHFDSDVVRSYLRDTHRVLRPGGRGFFHHSNYTGGHDWRKNPHSRNFMSRELLSHYAVKEGLTVVRQKTVAWSVPDLDCFSLVERC